MRWKRNVYFVHRWLGLVVGFQLLAWSIGGFTFSILDLDNVHGDFERKLLPPPSLRTERVMLSPANAVAAAGTLGATPDEICRVSLRERFGKTVYEIFDAHDKPLGAVDAVTGEVYPEISRAELTAAARADFAPDVPIKSIDRLEGQAPLEFRGGAMPVYRVVFDHPKHTHLYISPVTGEVLKRRNRPWRIFDFFWMLHIMDYGEREDFNHWLLTGASLFAILTSASGLGIWFIRVRQSRRRA